MKTTTIDDLKSVLNPDFKTAIYVAKGSKYTEMAVISAESLRSHNAGMQTVLFSDIKIDSKNIDFYVDLWSVFGSNSLPRALVLKPAILSKLDIGPFLFIDADTFVCGDLTPLWLGLETYPFLMVQDTWRYPEIYREFHPDLEYSPGHPSIPYFNTGLMLVRGDTETQKFLQEWSDLIVNETRFRRDQLALRILIEKKALSIGSLPQEYNARTCDPLQLSGRVFMIHDSTYDSRNRRKDLIAIRDYLNSSFRSRLWDPKLRKITYIQRRARQGRGVAFARRCGRWFRRKGDGFLRRLRLTRPS